MDTSEAKRARLFAERYGREARCGNCKHAFPRRVDATALTEVLECCAAPPLMQFVPTGPSSWAAKQVMRIVAEDYVCGAFAPAADRLS